MDNLEKYDLLEDLVDSISSIIDDNLGEKFLKYYVEQLKEIRKEAKQELQDLEDELREQKNKEIKAQFDEYWKSQF